MTQLIYIPDASSKVHDGLYMGGGFIAYPVWDDATQPRTDRPAKFRKAKKVQS